MFLSSASPNETLEFLSPELDTLLKEGISLDKKLVVLKERFKDFDPDRIFDFAENLSAGIDGNSFGQSFLLQPDLFLRVRPGKQSVVTEKLQRAGISFQSESEGCLRLNNATKLEEILKLNEEVVVQDKSSQRVAGFLPDFDTKLVKVWDCCAASGGKSLLVYDHYQGIELTVSDIRLSILENLSARLREARVQKFRAIQLDLAKGNSLPEEFDLVIADVPCSGSGTWARTPEQLTSFPASKLEHYSNLQHSILSNVQKSVRQGGYLLYITCSVFEKENESISSAVLPEFNLIKRSAIKCYQEKADTMFAALFQRIR